MIPILFAINILMILKRERKIYFTNFLIQQKMSKETIFLVTNNLDAGPGSLRDAINQANASLSPRSLVIIKPLKPNKITLNSEIIISSNIKIVDETESDPFSCHADPLRISGNNLNRIFHIIGPVTRTKIVSRNPSIILEKGQTLDKGGAIYVESSPHELVLKYVTITDSQANLGGGIFTQGKVTLLYSHITLNKAQSQGGGIWSEGGVVLQNSTVTKNEVVVPASSNGGGGIFVDNGNCLVNQSCVNHNKVAYDLSQSVGGNGGGIIVMTGSVFVQNNSHVDYNTSYNIAGIQEGIGNVYVTNNSSVSYNEAFNSASGASGGGGIFLVLGLVYLFQSQVSYNKTAGMYSGGVVVVVGELNVSQSTVQGNTNRGPGGGLAMNFGSVSVNQSLIADNVGASIGGAIVNFSPSPRYISIVESKINGNILTNAQTIQQSIKVFLSLITEVLSTITQQALVVDGPGGQNFITNVPIVLAQLTDVSNALNLLPIDQLGHNTIGGGALGGLLSSSIIVEKSEIENNFVGQEESSLNTPYHSLGGGIFALRTHINVQESLLFNNRALTKGGGIWNGNELNVSDSTIKKNCAEDEDGGGIFNDYLSTSVLINTRVNGNCTKRYGGGIKNDGSLELLSSQVNNNEAGVNGGGIFSHKRILKINTQIKGNKPNNLVVV